MSSIETSSIKIQPASSFLLFLTTKNLEPKYPIKTPRELDVPCKKKTWPLKSSAQAFSSLEIESVSCRNNTQLDYNLFFRYSISFNRLFFFSWLQTLNVICNQNIVYYLSLRHCCKCCLSKMWYNMIRLGNKIVKLSSKLKV